MPIFVRNPPQAEPRNNTMADIRVTSEAARFLARWAHITKV